MSEIIMTQEEKNSRVSQATAGIAFGGGTVTLSMRNDLLDVLDNKKTHEQVCSEIIERYTK